MMDKAKAYDEALKIAQYWLNDPQTIQDCNYTIKDAIQNIFPQLKENDDERVRKDIIDHFESIKSRALYDNQEESDNIISSCNEKIAYLEKQKEETENATKTLAKILEDSAEGFRRILKKKGIDYEVSDKFWENEAGVYSKEENVKFHKWMDDLMGPTPVEETNAYKKGLEPGMKQKEQKPTEQLGGTFTSYDMAKTFTEGQNYVIAHPEKFDLCKPAEWSDDIIRKAVKEVGLTQHQINWFKTNVFPPKQEWSEEDEEMLDIVLTMVDCSTVVPHSGGQLHPSESYKKDISDWLKYLCHHWKPTEEQMKALKNSAYGTYQNGDGPALRELYEQLLKLGVKEHN